MLLFHGRLLVKLYDLVIIETFQDRKHVVELGVRTLASGESVSKTGSTVVTKEINRWHGLEYGKETVV